MGRLFKHFQRDILGLLWLAAGFFLSLSLYSFDPSDPSLNSIGDQGDVKNYCGYFGSFLADILFQGVGLAAWLTVFFSFQMSYLGFLGKKTGSLRWNFLWVGLFILTAVSLGSLHYPEMKFYFRSNLCRRRAGSFDFSIFGEGV